MQGCSIETVAYYFPKEFLWRHCSLSVEVSERLIFNYSPVSLTSNICKIFDSILTRAMHGHLEINRLISIEQHGFVSSKACVTNLVECLDLTKNALHKRRKLDVLYTNFMKAFDKVSHLKLIDKLKAYGFGCSGVATWLRGYAIAHPEISKKITLLNFIL